MPPSGRGRGQALEFQGKKRKTRRELFLERMDGLIPWQRLEERSRPPAFKGAGLSNPVMEDLFSAAVSSSFGGFVVRL